MSELMLAGSYMKISKRRNTSKLRAANDIYMRIYQNKLLGFWLLAVCVVILNTLSAGWLYNKQIHLCFRFHVYGNDNSI